KIVPGLRRPAAGLVERVAGFVAELRDAAASLVHEAGEALAGFVDEITYAPAELVRLGAVLAAGVVGELAVPVAHLVACMVDALQAAAGRRREMRLACLFPLAGATPLQGTRP